MDTLDLMQFSPVLLPCANVFRSNLRRVAKFQVLPSELVFQSRRDDVITNKAIERMTGMRRQELEDFHNEECSVAIQSEVGRLFDEFNVLPFPVQMRLRDQLGIQYIEEMLTRHEGLQSSMDAILASMILLSWTAFECFAGDLWCAGVDHGPQEVANRLLSQNFPKARESIDSAEELYPDYDGRKRLGSYLSHIGKVSFLRLNDIRFWYGAAFGQTLGKLFDSVMDGRIVALAAFRNVITHAGGVADRDFCKHVERFPEFAHIKKGDYITLDGELVTSLRDAAPGLGVALLAEVNKQIPA